jgi:hypothetical protein
MIDILSILTATGRILRLRFERGRYAATLAGPDGETESLGAKGASPAEAFEALAGQVAAVRATGWTPDADEEAPTERIRFSPPQYGACTVPRDTTERSHRP